MSGNTQYLYIGNQNEPLSQLNGYESGSFTVGTGIPGDPAYGCSKNFVSNFMCGTKNKTLNIDGEAGGKKAIFDCSDQVDKCNDTPTVGLMQDDGNFVIYDGSSSENKSTTRWNSNTAGQMSSSQGTDLITQKIKTSIKPGEKILPGQNLVNPNKNGSFVINTDGNVNVIKTILNQSKDQLGNVMGVGEDNPSFALYQLDPNNAAKNLFKTGYVDIDGVLHDYPDNMIEYKDKYSPLLDTNAPGYDLVNLGNIGRDACEKNCNARNDCGLYQMDNSNGNCWLKSSDAYTKGDPYSKIGMAAYLRMKGPLARKYDYKNYQQMDSSGHDIRCTSSGEVNSKQEVENLCNKDESCAAYNWNQSSKTGCLKDDTAYSEGNTGSNFTENTSYEYNVKLKSGGSSAFLGSCSQNVEGINSTRWDSYVKGAKMTSTTKCGLARITEKDKRELEVSEEKLNELSNVMKNKITLLTGREKKLNKYFVNYYNKMEQELKKFKKEYSEFKETKKQEESIEAMNDDSEIQMISHGNNYTIFSIVAIIMVFALIKLNKGIKK